MTQWDQQHHATTKFYSKVTNLQGYVVLIPPKTCTKLSIGVLVTTQNTKGNRSITCTCNNIGGCASENEDYITCNHNLINVLIINDNDTTPSTALAWANSKNIKYILLHKRYL